MSKKPLIEEIINLPLADFKERWYVVVILIIIFFKLIFEEYTRININSLDISFVSIALNWLSIIISIMLIINFIRGPKSGYVLFFKDNFYYSTGRKASNVKGFLEKIIDGLNPFSIKSVQARNEALTLLFPREKKYQIHKNEIIKLEVSSILTDAILTIYSKNNCKITIYGQNEEVLLEIELFIKRK